MACRWMNAGNVYISNGEGVMAFDPDGNNILKIPIGGGATNNTFAGRDGKTLFITGPAEPGDCHPDECEGRGFSVARSRLRAWAQGLIA